MSLPSDPTSGTQMQTGSPADGFVDLRMSSGRMMAVSLGLLTRGTVERKVSSKEKASSSPARSRVRRADSSRFALLRNKISALLRRILFLTWTCRDIAAYPAPKKDSGSFADFDMISEVLDATSEA